jgi:hypothetical protein
MRSLHASHRFLCIAESGDQSDIWDRQKEMTMSTKNNSMRGGFLGRALAVFGAAAHASAALEAGRQPAKRDLVTLGIDPNAFERR